MHTPYLNFREIKHATNHVTCFVVQLLSCGKRLKILFGPLTFPEPFSAISDTAHFYFVTVYVYYASGQEFLGYLSDPVLFFEILQKGLALPELNDSGLSLYLCTNSTKLKTVHSLVKTIGLKSP